MYFGTRSNVVYGFVVLLICVSCSLLPFTVYLLCVCFLVDFATYYEIDFVLYWDNYVLLLWCDYDLLG